jgi:putative ABC transport system permease protein
MQRVAIARALVNSPDIILADEPTGALDSENSKMIMQLLQEVSKERLVIVVTHNPELAQEYSTRIIKLLNGSLIEDSNPYTQVLDTPSKKREEHHKKMSFFSALKLSLSNLLTKKTRTLLTTIAGSIGIIGIALILSVSAAVNGYVADVERDTLMANPLTI